MVNNIDLHYWRQLQGQNNGTAADANGNMFYYLIQNSLLNIKDNKVYVNDIHIVHDEINFQNVVTTHYIE